MTGGRGTSFGKVAALYDRRRPSYPDAAVDHILSLAPGASTVVDVGCGTGKGSAPFAARGLHVIGVEPDPAMADVARRHLSRVDVAAFEEWPPPADPVDVVLSAQAWHWVDPAVGVPKAASLLRVGGVFAVMANVPRDGGHDRRAELDPVYERVVGGLYKTTGMLNWDGQFDDLAKRIDASGSLDRLDPWHLDWDEPLSADGFAELMQTHSDYLLLDRPVLDELVRSVRDAIGPAGITMRYRTRVTAARRR